MNKVKLTFFAILIFFVCIASISANTLNSIKINASLDANGNMHVTEVWNMYNQEDTEVYKEEYNLGNMKINNFKVADDSREYTLNSNWNIHGSFDDKKYQYGINSVDEGIELCWGISEYGNKTYTISYDIENAVFNTSDYQSLYIKLVNSMNTPPEKFEIIITGPTDFSDSLDVWGYGYKGYAYVSEGKIFMSNEENTELSSSDYAVLLVKFPSGTFNIRDDNKYSEYENFDDVLNKAKEGSYNYDYGDNEDSFFNKLYSIFRSIIWIFFFIGIPAIIAKNAGKYKFGEAGSKIDMKNINAFRDIPCKKDIYRAYFISQAYKLNKNKTDFLGAIFLKWLNEDKIKIFKAERKKLFGTKEVTCVDLKEIGVCSIPVENDMSMLIINASGDGILEEDEFEKYSKKHYKEIFEWFDDVEEYGRNLYVEESLVSKKGYKYLIDDKVKQDAIELAGLKKYLTEFAYMNEKQPIEVKLWKEYLMYAQIFGIADEVAKQFKKLYPEIISEMKTSNLDVTDIILLNHFSHAAVVSASSARSAAQSYSAGGGGFSSGGGGGGSFGGGGGGTR